MSTMINFPPYPLLVHTPLGDGYVVYITTNGISVNDEVTVALKPDGQWRHFTTGDVRMHKNATYGINPVTDAEFEAPPSDDPHGLLSIIHAIKNDLQLIRESFPIKP